MLLVLVYFSNKVGLGGKNINMNYKQTIFFSVYWQFFLLFCMTIYFKYPYNNLLPFFSIYFWELQQKIKLLLESCQVTTSQVWKIDFLVNWLFHKLFFLTIDLQQMDSDPEFYSTRYGFPQLYPSG